MFRNEWGSCRKYFEPNRKESPRKSQHLQLSIFLTTASEPGSVHRTPHRNALNMIGANANRLIPNTDADPISASVAHRGTKCRVIKL